MTEIVCTVEQSDTYTATSVTISEPNGGVVAAWDNNPNAFGTALDVDGGRKIVTVSFRNINQQAVQFNDRFEIDVPANEIINPSQNFVGYTFTGAMGLHVSLPT
ncbi:hypothetical protein [Roseibium sp. RKSG952]|uniref:hypothetical protein n=1 Tax=Roseibium sp. RKSG952 TaxID=2529384 RepID=UPI0012BBB4D1|nr:hypothetical protein [Roseibium sp. RKSG952]MTH97181.1 hypothetical protein [Roseibium sp. RKSG952]